MGNGLTIVRGDPARATCDAVSTQNIRSLRIHGATRAGPHTHGPGHAKQSTLG
jgi:hypothetical protein